MKTLNASTLNTLVSLDPNHQATQTAVGLYFICSPRVPTISKVMGWASLFAMGEKQPALASACNFIGTVADFNASRKKHGFISACVRNVGVSVALLPLIGLLKHVEK